MAEAFRSMGEALESVGPGVLGKGTLHFSEK